MKTYIDLETKRLIMSASARYNQTGARWDQIVTELAADLVVDYDEANRLLGNYVEGAGEFAH